MNSYAKLMNEVVGNKLLYLLSRPARYHKIESEFASISRHIELSPTNKRGQKIVLVHVPKCAGTSLHAALYGEKKVIDHIPVWKFLTFIEKNKLKRSEFVFLATYREPISRVLSGISFLKKGGFSGKLNELGRKILSYKTTDDFIEKALSPFMGDIVFFPQNYFVSLNKKLVCDFYFNTSTISEDFKIFSEEQFGKVINLPHINQSVGDFTISGKSEDIIRTMYKADYSLLSMNTKFPNVWAG